VGVGNLLLEGHGWPLNPLGGFANGSAMKHAGEKRRMSKAVSNVVRLDDWEGERLPTNRYCPNCDDEHARVFVKRGRLSKLTAHCCACDYPIFDLKPRQVFNLVHYLRRHRGKRVHVGGGGAAA
jgi:hypothetical protein